MLIEKFCSEFFYEKYNLNARMQERDKSIFYSLVLSSYIKLNNFLGSLFSL